MSDALYAVMDAQGQVGAGQDPGLDPALLTRLYENMLLVRTLDARMMNLQRQGRIGFFGTTTGEEAAVLGSVAALRDTDWIFPALRQGAALLWRGFALRAYVAQLIGNTGDVLNGHQMPCHYADRAVNVVSWSSCIATQLPHAVGMAFAARYKKTGDIAVGYLGDGATSSPDFHAAMNFAGVWKAPVVFVCQNNHWAISVPVSSQTAVTELTRKAAGYGVPAVRVDGNDALAVYAVVQQAVQRASSGQGPTLIEMITYRAGAHSTSDDPTAYREKGEHERQLKRDPLRLMRRYLEHQGAWSDQDEKRFEAAVTSELQACIDRAEATPPPAVGSMFEQVFERMPKHLLEQQRECVDGARARKPH